MVNNIATELIYWDIITIMIIERFINFYRYNNNTMRLELLNPHVIKILITARKEDAISAIAKRISLSYGWTQKWVGELIREGIFKKKWKGIILQEENKAYKKILEFVRRNLNSIDFYYSVLNLFGIEYCFTKTDAVFIWTKGGYNIARYKDYYPIFIKIKNKDYPIFQNCCKKLGLNISTGKVFYSPEKVQDFKCGTVNSWPVEPLDKTIKFMKKNIYNFQPALEMIKEEYGKDIKTKYKEFS